MENKYYPNLFKKGKIGNVVLKNRIVRNSMGTYLGNPDGSVSSRQIQAYVDAAEGGAGLIFMDNATPVPMTSCGLRADGDEFIAGLSQLADALKMHGAAAGIQLAHPGRDAGFVGSADVIGASPITFEPWYEAGAKLPRELSVDEIHDLVSKFGDAALRCKHAGFDVVEIHGAAGCIPTNFLSPHDNHRTDMYGGSLHNRMRLLIEIVRDMKKKCGSDFPIGVKLSTVDWEPEGITLDETIEVAKALEKEGVSHINVMAGTHATAAMEFLMPNCFNGADCKKIADAVNIPVFIGHNIFTPDEAEELLKNGCGEFVALGRSQLADPHWAIKAKYGQASEIKPCINCLIGCLDRGLLNHTAIHCTVNPGLYKFEKETINTTNPRNVVVIGAGPAGCEAALTAANNGHKVTIYEKREFGGAMIEAAKPENKKNIRRLISYYKDHIDAHKNITVINKEATYEEIVAGNYDVCIAATGGVSRKIKAKNIDSQMVVNAMDYLGGEKVDGNTVVVIGGGITGAEVALELKAEGKKVIIVEMTDHFLAQKSNACQAYSIAISKTDIEIKTGLRLIEVGDHNIVLTDRYGNEQNVACDNVVIAAGFVPDNSIYTKLEEETDMQVFNVGDAKRVRQIYDAVHEGYIAAKLIH